jgi:hypothetical protein
VTGLARRRRGERGQGLVEFAIILPAFMLILLAMLEFGFLFDHTLTIQYGTREGARVGSALVNGGGPLGCPTVALPNLSPNANTVDPLIIAAVTRVLKSPGSRVDPAQVKAITIYDADSSGNQIGSNANVWRLQAGPAPSVNGYTLATGADTGWAVCSRTNYDSVSHLPDSIGVRLTYTYNLQTALGNVLRFFGGSGLSSIAVSDKTVMAMNPTN